MCNKTIPEVLANCTDDQLRDYFLIYCFADKLQLPLNIVKLTTYSVGLLANSFGIWILWSMPSIFNYLLMALTTCDNICILCFLFIFVLAHASGFPYEIGDHNVEVATVVAFHVASLSAVMTNTALYITCILAVERYLCLTRPIQHRLKFGSKSPLKHVCCRVLPIIIIWTLLEIPGLFEAKIVRTDSTENGRSKIIISDWVKHEAYIVFYKQIFFALFAAIIPMFLLCFFNFRICW